ncbi:MAG: sulfotransferase [Pseudomonadota bacterium]
MNQPQPLPSEAARQLGAQFAFAKRLYDKKQLQQAGQICEQLLQQVSDHQGALHLLVMVSRDLGQLDTAGRLLQRLESLAGAGNTDVIYEWGVLHVLRGEPQKAEARLKSLLKAVPAHANGHRVLGRLYDRLGRLGAAEMHLRHALELRQDDETLCKDLASVNERLGLFDTGIRFARRAFNLNPRYIDGLLVWAKLEERRGDLDEAERLVDYALTLQPGHPLVVLLQAFIQRRRGDFDKAYGLLEAMDISLLNPDARAIAWQERGFCLERLGRFDEAFAAFSRMSEINRKPPFSRNYPEEEMQRQFAELREFWQQVEPDSLPTAPTPPEEAPTPIFIVGFPRSGTTLVEQIVTSHPEVLAGDETHAIDLAMGRRRGSGSAGSLMDITRSLVDTDAGKQVLAMQNAYMHQVRRQAVLEPGYRYFTDKTPLNEVYMGVIRSILPQSPMIHLIRHPLNVVLSSYFNDVRHGRDFATRLETTAKHYAHVMDMVETYTERLDLRYLQVRYEDIVNDLETEARRIIDFIGLPWDERCLQFHENDRHVRTASAEQVKEKLYTRSLERYKPFLKHLEPVIPILEPYIERYKYTI